VETEFFTYGQLYQTTSAFIGVALIAFVVFYNTSKVRLKSSNTSTRVDKLIFWGPLVVAFVILLLMVGINLVAYFTPSTQGLNSQLL
jgi:hypothetical protein